MPIPLLPGPLLYLYLLSFKQRITWKKAFPHFIIFILFFFAVRWNISFLSERYPNSEAIPSGALRRPATMILAYLRGLQPLVYFFLARRALLSYQRSIQQLFSETSRINMNWARYLVNGFLIIIAAFFVIFPVVLSFPEYFNVLLLLNMAIATPYIYIATYKGILQPTIWQLKPGTKKEVVEKQIHEVEEVEVNTSLTLIKKSDKPGPDPGRTEEIVRKITALMTSEKLFQEPELTLQQLADKLETPSYQVSQALNEGMKKSFYDVINGYRVEEAKRLLLDPDSSNYTVLSVGFEAGFNSKTTFNTVFKKFTGLTPTDFRQKHFQAALLSA
jgi:AraC-like DNA-binding protein